jgi:Uma2 family endonuclease
MAEPVRRPFTVSEFHSMAEAGILSEDDRVELIEGEIYRMAPIGSRHAACVNRLNHLLQGTGAILSPQNPLVLNDRSEPQPDLALLRWRDDFYATSHPSPGDVLLLIEVADTSVGFDRGVKTPLYAQRGIPELWLVDLTKGFLEVHQHPSLKGYQQVRRYGKGDRLSPQAFPELELNVSDILV